jgi:RNA polymerase sigma-70 factor (ECF subfamily)
VTKTGQKPDADDQSFGAVSDGALMARVTQARDKAAFGEIFRRYAGKLRGFMAQGGAPIEEAEEAAQDVLMTVWRKAELYDPAKASLGAWIYAVARNRRTDLYRRRARPTPDPEDPLFQRDPDPPSETLLAESDRDRMVTQALASLSEDQAAVVRLAFYEGLSHGEVAERLGAPVGTVKSRLRLAFKKLREALGSSFQEELRSE